MFEALHLSLSTGGSYANVQVFSDEDIAKYNLPKPFEQWTSIFGADGDCIIAHHWQVLLIKISNERIPAGHNSISVKRMILVGDVVYEDIKIVDQEQWWASGVPSYFDKMSGISGQLVFTSNEGTFITHDSNCVSIVIDRPHSLDGVIKSHFVNKNSAQHLVKQAAKTTNFSTKILNN